MKSLKWEYNNGKDSLEVGIDQKRYLLNAKSDAYKQILQTDMIQRESKLPLINQLDPKVIKNFCRIKANNWRNAFNYEVQQKLDDWSDNLNKKVKSFKTHLNR